MVSDDDYRREEDRKWRDRTEERVLMLTSSETVQNDRLDDVDEEIATIKTILEGKPDDKNDNGIKGDLHDLAVNVNALRALMAPDSLGQGGIITRIKALEKKAGIEEKEAENRWKFLTALAVAIVSATALVLTNLDRIGPSLKKLWNIAFVTDSPVTITRPIQTTRRHRVRIRVIEAPQGVSHDGPTQEMPEGRSGDGSHAE